MDASLAQMVYLVAHGAQFLSDGRNQALHLYEFPWVRELRFVLLDGDAKELVVAGDMPEHVAVSWFRDLRSRGIDDLRLAIDYARVTPLEPSDPPFPNREAMAIAASGRGVAEHWTARWARSEDPSPDGRIWTVGYEGRIAPTASLESAAEMGAATAALTSVLSDCIESTSHGPTVRYREVFQQAQRVLSAPQVDADSHGGLLPDTAPLAAKQLLAASRKAWQFGHMASWEFDVSYLDSADPRLSPNVIVPRLQRTVLSAVEAAANSTADAAGSDRSGS